MSDTQQAQMPYQSRKNFLANGTREIILGAAFDCSICQEPLMTVLDGPKFTLPQSPTGSVLSLPHVASSNDPSETCKVASTPQTHDGTTTTPTEAAIEPESAVRVLPCDHIFARACLTTWFTTSRSNRCPECNHELFPNRHLMLFLREPTLSMRLAFAKYIEEVCGDHKTAHVICNNVMSDWTRMLIREFAMELWRRQGYEVEYQYVGGVEDEQEEDEDIFDDEEEDDARIDELVTDGSGGDDERPQDEDLIEVEK